MRKSIPLLVTLLLLTFTSAYGREFAGVSIPETCTIDGQVLRLNGCGLRTKFFFKIYAGALYTPDRVTRAADLYKNDLPKVIRMHFIYHRVSASQMRDAFADDFDNNIPGFSKTADARAFSRVFSFDVPAGDVIDLVFHADGALTIVRNGSTVATFHSATLNRAVLAIYFGADPVSESLKKGMLGKK